MTSTGPSWTTDEFHENFSFQSLFPPLHLFLCYIIHVLSLSSFLFQQNSLTDRSSGQGRNDNTIQSHMVGVKFWMTDGLSKDAVLAQENIGAKDGSIDSHLKAAK